MHRSLRITAATVGLVLLAGAATAQASHDAETIHGCVDNRHGDLRVVLDPAACTKAEVALDWNRQGTPGPPGPEGPAGPTGPAGPVGADGGLAGYEIVEKLFEVGPGESEIELVCPEGKVPVGGGFSSSDPDIRDVAIRRNAPSFDGRGWAVTVERDVDFFSGVTVYVVCATPAG